MITSLTILVLVLALPVALSLGFWTIILIRVSSVVRRQPSVRAGIERPEPADGWPALSVIVPAHNEERVIDACAASLADQDYDDLEIIFVVDRSTDGTAETLRRHVQRNPRIVVLENEQCPDDWAGKCNAARIGAERARGDWLLFTDADTWFDPRLCRSSVALAVAGNAHMITLLSTLNAERFHELSAQPVACFSLIQLYPMTRIGRGRTPRPFANGQFMLFRRDWYDRIGGHAAVKGELLEDLAFARRLSEQNGRSEVLLAEGMLRCSMYDSLQHFMEGWRRIFIDACGRKPRRLRKRGWWALLTGVAVPIIQIAGVAVGIWLLARGMPGHALPLLAVVLASAVAQVLALRLIYTLAGAPKWAIILYGPGSWIVGRILLCAARDLERGKPILWGGRQYVPEPR